MSRALEVIEPTDTRPDVPREPVPKFTYQIHTEVATCSKRHIFSCSDWDMRMAWFFREDATTAYDELCPHCQRDAWAAARDAVGDDTEAYERRQRVRAGEPLLEPQGRELLL